MKNVLKEIQDSISAQNTYYFQIQCDHLNLPQNLIKNSFFKDSHIKLQLFKDNKLIGQTFQSIHSTILGQKLLLNLVRLKFSATLFDIQRNIPIALIVIKALNQKQQYVTQFKLIPAKYVQSYNLEGQKHFLQKLKSKLGLTVQMSVCIQKTRSRLQNIIKQVQLQKKRKRSESAKRSRLKSPLIVKSIRNSLQNQEQSIIKSKTNMISKSNKSLHSLVSLAKNKSQNNYANSSKIESKQKKKDRQELKISKITQLNSQDLSQMSRSFSNSPILIDKEILQPLFETHNKQQQVQQIISELSQLTSKELLSKKVSLNSVKTSQIFSYEQQSSISRSTGIVLSSNDDSTSMNSSMISQSSQLNRYKVKRNKTCYIILIIIGMILLFNALLPSKKMKKMKNIL